MSELKQCPYCGEMIQSTAKKCRYCGEWLDNESVEINQTTSKSETKVLVEDIPSILEQDKMQNNEIQQEFKQEEIPEQELVEYRQKRRKELLIGICSVVVLIIAIIIFDLPRFVAYILGAGLLFFLNRRGIY